MPRSLRTNGRTRPIRVEIQLDQTTKNALLKAATNRGMHFSVLAFRFVQEGLRKGGFLQDLPAPEEFI